jgi:hypothetical protein
MSAFETLPPDQRAVLQLILKQGRGYADLSGLLRIDEAAVRARAHAGLDALAPNGAGAALSPERRGQIGDYLLGQQDDADRAVTLQHLEDSRAARRWAGALHDSLAPYANGSLPDLPTRNGVAPSPAPEAVDEIPLEDAQPVEEAPTTEEASSVEPPPPAKPSSPSFDWDHERAPRRSSKLGGALLIGGIAVLIVVVLIVVINGGGGDDDNPATSQPAQTQAQQQQQRTSGNRAAAADDTAILQQVNLRPPGGGDAPLGVAFIVLRDQRPMVAVEVARIAPNGDTDVYAAWLRQSSDGQARFLGYVPGLVGADGRFVVSANLPRDTADFDQIVISRESTDARVAPARPSSIELQGAIRVNRTG